MSVFLVRLVLKFEFSTDILRDCKFYFNNRKNLQLCENMIYESFTKEGVL